MKTRIKSKLLALSAALAVLSTSALAKDLTFGYVAGSLKYPYNVATADGFKEAAAKAGAKAVVLDPQGDVEKQGNAIDDLLAQGVDGIGFLPLDSVVAESFVDKISEKSIPSAAIAVQVGDPNKRSLKDVYPKLNALITPDDFVAGEQAAKLALTLLPKDRAVKIAIVEGAPGYSAVTQRSAGFKKALETAGLKYEIVGSQPTDWTPEKGEAVCQNFLTATPDIDLIFSQADDMAIGCARALDAAQSKAKLIATSGGSKLGNAAIAAGELDGSVCVKPKMLGQLMFKALHEAATNPSAPKAQLVSVDLPIITKETLDQCPAEW
ncbi:sugar ABC transporter substrate-binding protein [Mesorhizobium sp. M4A.F.Ca.ET.050.02.1.1]|uniref:sugar ABC transporter substrate-binding protein n=1 Tax=Mesorhizobium sp. M4A.F.Ca.ET.050.02.1.1 TaxID=2496754 RepID=UPI000FCCA072|nr:sugar ABC transporter substrate-binding protein [Mesorhizobium sp. M4A.F.Ca.ET.050.02.1.1]RUX48992.1 sugar ABC transporter substrate-binding protein [Mesorhizobium sp. M4A.F.Ca.ET.050.02.1.1]